MAVPGSILSPARRPKWLHITVGAVLIVIVVTLTVGWQILGVSDIGSQRVHPLRFVVYFLGTVLFLGGWLPTLTRRISWGSTPASCCGS